MRRGGKEAAPTPLTIVFSDGMTDVSGPKGQMGMCESWNLAYVFRLSSRLPRILCFGSLREFTLLQPLRQQSVKVSKRKKNLY